MRLSGLWILESEMLLQGQKLMSTDNAAGRTGGLAPIAFSGCSFHPQTIVSNIHDSKRYIDVLRCIKGQSRMRNRRKNTTDSLLA